jgi:hypothetical protein
MNRSMARSQRVTRLTTATPRLLLLAAMVGLLFVGSACARRAPVHIESIDVRWTHGIHPTRSIYDLAPDGTYNILIVEDPPTTVPRRPERPLQPAADVPLRQVVHLRVFWRPRRGTEPDHPAAANATVHWYVIGVGTAQGQDMVRYEGTGIVSVYAGQPEANINLQNAYLRVRVEQGRLRDPVGPVVMHGTAQAAYRPQQVEQLLTELRQLSAGRTLSADAVPLDPLPGAN